MDFSFFVELDFEKNLSVWVVGSSCRRARGTSGGGVGEMRHDMVGEQFHRPHDVLVCHAAEPHPADEMVETRFLAEDLDVADEPSGGSPT